MPCSHGVIIWEMSPGDRRVIESLPSLSEVASGKTHRSFWSFALGFATSFVLSTNPEAHTIIENPVYDYLTEFTERKVLSLSKFGFQTETISGQEDEMWWHIFYRICFSFFLPHEKDTGIRLGQAQRKLGEMLSTYSLNRLEGYTDFTEHRGKEKYYRLDPNYKDDTETRFWTFMRMAWARKPSK